MSTEILVNIGQQETRVALVEGGAAQEIYIQRASRHGLVGNIYKGVVQRVLPGMQAAFIEIGLERTAFLHVGDMVALPNNAQAHLHVEGAGNGAANGSTAGQGNNHNHNHNHNHNNGHHDRPRELPAIQTLLYESQEVLVQVLKDPLGSKGARLTTLLSVPSRYLVLLPYEPHCGASARIEDDSERARLKQVVARIAAEQAPKFGVIARTAAEGVDESLLADDLKFLLSLWTAISEQARVAPPRSLVHGDLPLSMRILRDLLGTDVERVRIDSAEEFRSVQEFARVFVPYAAGRIEHYAGAAPIFDLYGVEDDIDRALSRKVDLKSGGHLVIDQTEAMTTIDVNTGAFTGHRNLEETILKTNLEAAQAIARQLRLRNLGGIIVLDFIDMRNSDHRVQVMRALEKELRRDPARTHVYEFSPLGLVEMTRKRSRESLGHILCMPCPTCEGRGAIKTVETLCHDIVREVSRAARQFEARHFLVLANPAAVQRLTEDASMGLAELEASLNRPIRLQAEASYHPESFDVVPL